MFDPFRFLPNPHDALQAPDHRWLRCQYLLDSGQPPTPEDDALTQTAYTFSNDWRHCRNDAQRQQLARAHPALAQAHGLYHDAALLQRAEVEARLLAGECDASIESKCQLTLAVVQLFHDLFFDVRPYLQAPAYLVHNAIGPKVHYGLQRDDYDLLLKIAGYTLGASGVDALLAYWADPPAWPVSLEQLDDAALQTFRSKLRMQVWILSQILPANADTAARLPAIRHVLAQVGVLGNGSLSDENNLLSACQTPLDYRAFLCQPEATACTAAASASAGVASNVGASDGLVLPGPTEWQAVPA